MMTILVQSCKVPRCPPQPQAFYKEMGIVGPDGKPQFIPFFPNPNSIRNQIGAAVHRFGRKMPDIKEERGKDFERYFRKMIDLHCGQLEDSEVKDFYDWIDSCSYTGGRKAKLEEIRREMERVSRGFKNVEGFIKYESYPEPKHARGILSYTDESKVLLGPLCKAIDKKTFSTLPYFVKGTDPTTWPLKMQQLFKDLPVMTTDFSSFEAHHREVFARCVAYWMKHVTKRLKEHRHLVPIIDAMVMGVNFIKFSKIHVYLLQRLMSGALWTSSANGMLNLGIMSYLALRKLYPTESPEYLAERFKLDFRGFVEGDDGICQASNVDEKIIEELGISLKFEYHPNFSTAGFCSIFCDEQSLECVKDPRKVLQSFFALPKELLDSKPSGIRAYLRYKALSYKYLFCNAPIVGPLMDWVLKRTASTLPCTNVKLGSFYDQFVQKAREERIWLKTASVRHTARVLVEDLFHIPIDMQLQIESSFDHAKDWISLDLSLFVTPDMIHYREHFLTESRVPVEISHHIVSVVDDIASSGQYLDDEKHRALMQTISREKARFRKIPEPEPLMARAKVPRS